ncbi:MAG: hypothetical protein HZA01_14240 [Nitrospinae bacterium]|nr:hypothetical protein [Nitrospinota bacterium]
MKTLTGFLIGLAIFGFLFYAVDQGLMKSQGLQLFPEEKAAEKATGKH